MAVNLTNPVLNTSERIQGEQNFLLDGTYDEAKSTQSFQDALMEWRSGDIPVSSKQCITYSSEGMHLCTYNSIGCTWYVHCFVCIVLQLFMCFLCIVIVLFIRGV